MTYVEAVAAGEVPVGTALRVMVGGTAVAVVHAEDGFHALDDRCSHADVSLAEGEVEGCTIECWLHGSAFDLSTGQPLTPPATRPVKVYPVQLTDEGIIEIDIHSPLEGQS